MKTSNLVLHCGARSVTREYLASVPAPPSTDTWCPIPHIQLVNEVERSLAAAKMEIINQAYGLTVDNDRMFGLLQVASGGAEDYAYVIGLRGSLDKSLSRGIAAGACAFVCDNLSFSSEIVMHRRQTTFINRDLPLVVDTAIGQLGKRWANQTRQIETYKHTAISDNDAAYLLLEKLAGDVFPEQKLPDIWREFKAPRHVEFEKGTVWAMFNAVTEFIKPKTDSKATGLWTMPARTGRLHKVCDDYAGLVINVNEATPEGVKAAEAIAPSIDPTTVVAIGV